MTNENKTLYISIFIAVLFHFSGVIGMFTEARSWFISMTPLTLLLMTALILWNEKTIQKQLWMYIILCVIVGFLSEVIGTNTGLLFGMYAYGEAFGYKVAAVPILIGMLWFVTVYSVGHTVLYFYKLLSRNSDRSIFINFLLITLAAAMTTVFDYVLEPAAISLGYWQWYPDGSVPIFNYVCWFFISGFLHVPFFMIRSLSNEINYFAVFLIFIQSLFLLLVTL
jgi:bisanhydrobacterioruberin hydratase